MLTKKQTSILVVAGVLLLALGSGSHFILKAFAQPQAQAEGSSSIIIPYSGQLTGDDGEPVADGGYDFTFTLYDAPDNGSLLWSEAQTGVSLQGGVFAVILGSVNPLPASAKNGLFWLGTSVRGPQDLLYAALTPRQQLSAVLSSMPASPTAAGTCEHTHIGEAWIGSVAWSNGAFKISNDLNGPSIWGVNTGGGNAIRGDGYGTSIGVYGGAVDGPGVTGESSTFFGLQGKGNDASGSDFIGDLWLDGLRGEILAGELLNVQSNGSLNLEMDRDDNGTASKVSVWTNNTTIVFAIDEAGNTWALGTERTKVNTADYGDRFLYSMESPEVWFEDFGTALLVNGVVTVTIESMFAETVNLSEYHVFVTPVCEDPVVLYITSKTPTSFTVKGVRLDSLPSDCSFDYRIIAKRLDFESVRMEEFDTTTQLSVDRK